MPQYMAQYVVIKFVQLSWLFQNQMNSISQMCHTPQLAGFILLLLVSGVTTPSVFVAAVLFCFHF